VTGNDWESTDEPKCSCRWYHTDTGTFFYSRVAKADPACPVHRDKPPKPTDTKETPGH